MLTHLLSVQTTIPIHHHLVAIQHHLLRPSEEGAIKCSKIRPTVEVEVTRERKPQAHVDSSPRAVVEKATTVHFRTSPGVAAVELVASEEEVKVSNRTIVGLTVAVVELVASEEAVKVSNRTIVKVTRERKPQAHVDSSPRAIVEKAKIVRFRTILVVVVEIVASEGAIKDFNLTTTIIALEGPDDRYRATFYKKHAKRLTLDFDFALAFRYTTSQLQVLAYLNSILIIC